ncbi:MAG: hypothetical protein IPK13_24340 [Deltaproteobacteria bacterium]|nr:hypothetical protein [Deltaproteobacteria bacterium]
MSGNGHALSWDGRLAFITRGVSPMKRPGLQAELQFQLGGLRLEIGGSHETSRLFFVMQGDGNLVLYEKSEGGVGLRALWSTQTGGQCSIGCFAVFQGDGNLVLYDQAGGTAKPYWASGTQGTFRLEVYSESPFIAVVNDDGTAVWSGAGAGVGAVGWAIRVFRPEALVAALEVNDQTFNQSFSADFPGMIALDADANAFPGSIQLGLPFLNALSVVPDPRFVENPYFSDRDGNALSTGEFLTYQAKIFTQKYSDPTVTPFNTQLGFFRATIVVRDPHSPNAAVERVRLVEPFAVMTDQRGQPIVGIEPTVTFDGRLLIYQRFDGVAGEHGSLYYTRHDATDAPLGGWSTPRRITEMSRDPTLPMRYPIARYAMVDLTGATIQGAIPGAYPWVSLDGSDVFFAGALHQDGAMRAGVAMVGASSKGLVRQVDGGPNVTRRGMFHRLFLSSLGRTPGMWSPLEFLDRRVLPLTDKLFTYPMFTSNAALYFETSYEETVVGNYELVLEMAEGLRNGDYVLDAVPDVSGHLHVASKNAEALFAEEAFPSECNDFECPPNDPRSDASRVFSGKAIYFRSAGALTALARSPSGHVILDGARDFTLSLAIRPLMPVEQAVAQGADSVNLIEKDGAFRLGLAPDGRLVGAVSVSENGGAPRELLFGPMGSRLPVDQWTHVAVTFEGATGIVALFIDGAPAGGAKLAVGGARLGVGPNDARPVIVGPAGSGSAVSGLVYALDQVCVSRVVRSAAELLRQANRVSLRRPLHPGRSMPLGLKAKDVKDPKFFHEAPNPAKAELGRHLFFDPRLSESNDVACETCHQVGNAFTERLSLHPSRVVGGTSSRLLRNTPTLLNLAFKDQFFHDGRAPTLEAQAVAVLTNPSEMGRDLDLAVSKLRASAQYQGLFLRAFPDENQPITADNMVESLADFERSLLAGSSRFDRYVAGDRTALNDAERAGRALFFGKARCAECHSGSALSDNAFHVLPFLARVNEDGVEDLGRARVTNTSEDALRFVTPSLRQISDTGPYFHNGSAKSLRDVLVFYQALPNVSGRPLDDSLVAVDLSTQELDQLEAFLRALRGEVAVPARPTFSDLPAPTPSALEFVPGSLMLRVNESVETSVLRLVMQGDGNLVAYDHENHPLFASYTQAPCSEVECLAVFQGDGNLVVYADGKPLWATYTHEGIIQGARFVLADRRPFLRVLTNNGSMAWMSGDDIDPGLILPTGRFVRWHHDAVGELFLIMQGDANLVAYRGREWGPTSAVWNTQTGGRDQGREALAAFQGDGNFVVYAGSEPLWATMTVGDTRRALRLQLGRQGPWLRLLGSTGGTLWSSN